MNDHSQDYVELDPSEWPSLWLEVSASIANAPYMAFVEQANKLGGRVAIGMLTVVEAAAALQAGAHDNQLAFYYGADRLQLIMSEAFVAAFRRELDDE